MKLLILASLFILVSCGKSAPKSSESSGILFISFQQNTQNFHVHKKGDFAESIDQATYLKMRSKTKIYERSGAQLNWDSDTFEFEVREYPENVTLCKDHGAAGIIDLECRLGVW